MTLSKLYYRVTILSPRIEVFMRRFYWRNISILNKFKPPKKAIIPNYSQVLNANFDQVIDFLRTIGVGEGSLLLVHSSYSPLKQVGYDADDIINKLLALIGKSGTLAMPVIRSFDNDPKGADILSTDMEGIISTYDVRNSKISSGYLPYCLMQRQDSQTSRFPLNPLTAVGALAQAMMAHNLEGELPSPHGINSSWKFCLDNNAIVIALGVQLARCITITHVAEEAFPNWPIDNWFRERIFNIKDDSFFVQKTILERKPKWGMLHYAENNLNKDLVKHNILKEKIVGNILVGVVNSQEYISFLRSRNKNGYPYVK